MHMQAFAAVCFAFLTAAAAGPIPPHDSTLDLHTTIVFFPHSVSDAYVVNAARAIVLIPNNYIIGYKDFNPYDST